MSKVALVSCVSAKRDHPVPAEDLYTSAWFGKASSYARQVADRWYVLSAEHGLVHPEDVLAPYEKTLNTMPVADRRAWAADVQGQIEQVVSPEDTLIFLAGARYREHLIAPLKVRGHTVEIPLEGLRIGEQLQRLGQLLAR